MAVERAPRSRWRWFGALAAVVALGIGTWLITDQLSTSGRSAHQEAMIRDAVDTAAVATDYELSAAPRQGSNQVDFTVTVSLKSAADKDVTGQLVEKLFDDSLNVSAIELRFDEQHSLRMNRLDRAAAEWSEFLRFTEGLDAERAELTQLGPAGVATYRLDITSADRPDPAASYEALAASTPPSWLSLGRVQLSTASGEWPKRLVDAGRPLTAAELTEFRDLDASLATRLRPGEQYSVSVVTTLGDATAAFDSRVIPAATTPPFSTDPTNSPTPSSTPEPSPENHSPNSAPDPAAPEEQAPPAPSPENPAVPTPDDNPAPVTPSEPAPPIGGDTAPTENGGGGASSVTPYVEVQGPISGDSPKPSGGHTPQRDPAALNDPSNSAD